jgi:hypothetical protein
MPNYSTSLKTWGATGQEFPDGYNYEEGEQPVDAWDNFFNSNVIDDIEHLIDVTNNDLMAVDGSTDLSGSLSDDDGYTIWDYNNKHIPVSSLEDSAISFTAGDGLAGGGTTSLGNSVTIEHDTVGLTNDYSAPSGYGITDVSFDNFGHVAGIQATNFDTRYIKESGDTMSGVLDMNNNGLHNINYLRSTSNDDFEWRDSNDAQAMYLDTTTDTLTVGGSKVWHADNDGSGSGLDADKIEGYDIQKDGNDASGVINFKTQ